jgi:lipoprotein-releasing system ATP-binding protein
MHLEHRQDNAKPLTSIIAVRNLTKSFRNGGVRVDILKGVTFDLQAGETLAIVGASGIGKSTLLHILGTLDRPDSGKFLFQGEEVFSYDEVKLAKFRNECVGFVFQFHHLLSEFSAVENAMIPALIQEQTNALPRKRPKKFLSGSD